MFLSHGKRVAIKTWLTLFGSLPHRVERRPEREEDKGYRRGLDKTPHLSCVSPCCTPTRVVLYGFGRTFPKGVLGAIDVTRLEILIEPVDPGTGIEYLPTIVKHRTRWGYSGKPNTHEEELVLNQFYEKLEARMEEWEGTRYLPA